VRDSLRRFALDVLRPVGAALDRLPAEEVYGAASPYWEAHRRYRELGLAELADAAGLTPVERARIGALSSEVLGWGDVGLAISLTLGGMPNAFAQLTGDAALQARCGRDRIGCWAVTEPGRGSDMVDMYGAERADKAFRGDLVARRDGDHFVLRGQKSAWVSNGSFAENAAVFCTFEEAGEVRGGGAFVVPLDLPGVSRGRPTDKIGQRSLNQGEIFFDDVVIPATHLVAGPEHYDAFLHATLTAANGGMGSLFAGLARAALEHAVNYARQRRQGGRPIIEHQGVRTRLFEMFRKVEAARALNLRVVAHNAVNPRFELAVCSKVTSTRAAVEVATEALTIFGGAGITRENPIEKLIRDATVSLIEDGENNFLGLLAAQRL
jgi:alkylation response protein AidB-like acyl-CoA dehydrogenase